MTTLAEKLGIEAGPSLLSEKADSLGLTPVCRLEELAVSRGCWHYHQPHMPAALPMDETLFSNEELAVALLSPSQPYSPNTIRLGAAMLGAKGNDPVRIASLARAESADISVRYVANAGLRFEPDLPLWKALVREFSSTADPPPGVFPHPTRFVSMTGFTRAGAGRVAVWIRPRPDLALTHG